MPLTFTVTAIKLVNHGGFVDQAGKRQATEYVVFVCPGCSQRNKQSMYAARYKTPLAQVAFDCWKCQSTVEVAAPLSKRQGSLIISPDEYKAQKKIAQAAR